MIKVTCAAGNKKPTEKKPAKPAGKPAGKGKK
jgi:hypothetical protein